VRHLAAGALTASHKGSSGARFELHADDRDQWLLDAQQRGPGGIHALLRELVHEAT
jgi:hypothetical protein